MDDAVRGADLLVVSMPSDVHGPGYLKIGEISDLPFIAEIRESLRLAADQYKGSCSYHGGEEYRLEFHTDSGTVVVTYKGWRYLGYKPWDSDFDLTREGTAFLAAFVRTLQSQSIGVGAPPGFGFFSRSR